MGGIAMCLGIPAKVLKIKEGFMADVEIGKVTREASLHLTPDAKEGDYVLLHTGFAISVIDEEQAKETLKLLEEASEALE